MINYASLAEAELTLGAYADWGLDTHLTDYIKRAQKLIQTAEKKFQDPHTHGYFLVSEKREDLSVRQKIGSITQRRQGIRYCYMFMLS
jgi:uncharacterized protein YyaL (SSP411 family)